MPMTDAQETCTRNWYQFQVPNRTCSVRYQNMVPDKIDARLHVVRTRNCYQSFWYQFLVQVSWSSVIGIRKPAPLIPKGSVQEQAQDKNRGGTS